MCVRTWTRCSVLAGGRRCKGNGGERAAGDILAEIVKVRPGEPHIPRALVIVGNGVVQSLLHLNHQLAAVLAAGDAVTGVADCHRTHIALGGNKGDLIEPILLILLVGGDFGCVIPFVFISQIQRTLVSGRQCEDNIAQRRTGLLLAGFGKQAGRQLQGRIPLGGDGEIRLFLG